MPTSGGRPTALAVVVLTLLLATPVLRAAEDDDVPAALLHKARDLENIHVDHEGALALYEKVYTHESATPVQRGLALRGAALCHERATRMAAAELLWTRISEDETLDASLRTWAREKRAARRKATGEPGLSPAEQERRLRQLQRKENLKRAREHVEAGREALRAGRFATARGHALNALSIDPDSAEGRQLFDAVEALSPDRGTIVRTLIRLFQSQDVVEYERVHAEVTRLGRAARVAADQAKTPREADRLYREAIRQIDESGFLNLGGAVEPGTLDELRTQFVFWLEQVHADGLKEGYSFEPIPPLPDLEARSGSLRAQFLGLLSRLFRPERAGADRLHFFEFAPQFEPGADARRSLSSRMQKGIRAAHAKSDLTRARWAERTIRRHIGGGWTDPSRKDGRARRRILVRLGNLICAQHGENEHRRIETLRAAFADVPIPLEVDVRVFAVDAGGAVRSAEALRTRAGPRDSGLDHVLAGRLLREYAGALDGLEGVQALGGATLRLGGITSGRLELTRFTAEHPAYLKLPPPQELVVEDSSARYGLWLDLYAETMPGHAGPGPRSALSVRARVTQPDSRVPSHVVPRNGPGSLAWSRLPLLTERVLEADSEVPHYGAFVLQGLPNPFPGTQASHPELLLLIGTTRQDTPTPDPPRTAAQPAIVPADLISRDYPVGSLSVEVEDEAVPEGWPVLRTAAAGRAAADRRRLRDGELANVLMGLARIDPESLGGRDAIVVQDHHAVGLLNREAHLLLQQAIQRLRSHENDLYQVTVLSAVVGAERWAQWSAREGLERNSRGHLLVAPAVRAALEEEMTALAARGALFDTRRVLLARATQQVAHVHLRSEAITKDLTMRRLAHNRVRFTPVPGVAEEGLVVEVRPMLESGTDGAGVRSVRVRVRAARLKSIDARPYPNAGQAAAMYDVPTWHAGSVPTWTETRAPNFSEGRDAEILSDENALLVPLRMPGVRDESIVVFLAVRKVQ